MAMSWSRPWLQFPDWELRKEPYKEGVVQEVEGVVAEGGEELVEAAG